MTPQPALASTGYCLAHAANSGAEYLVYLPRVGDPSGGEVTVDLSAAKGALSVEWFDPDRGETLAGGKTTGGARRFFTAPIHGDAVLYLRAAP